MQKNANISKVLIQIHSTLLSNRLEYTLNYVFKWRMGIDFTIITDVSKLDQSQTIINYSKVTIGCGIHIIPNGLLFDKGFNAFVGEDIKFNLNPIAPLKDSYSDLFSSIFYHLSRYEEYNTPKDKLGRFSYKSSCLFLNDFIERPLVDEWVNDFKNYLIQFHGFKTLDFKTENHIAEASIDIDSVFSYKGRKLFRTVAAFSKDCLTLNFKEILKRTRVLLNLENDPNDNFDLQKKLLNKKPAKYFVQVGKYGQLDKNVSLKNIEFQTILKELNKNGNQIGLHPSFASNSDAQIIKDEKEKLEAVIGKKITHSRQHYLKFELPKTYQTLIELGIENEYSMGYSEIAGFRAATAVPFHWFDLESEKTTKLLIHPFVVMDVAYKNFQNMSVDEAISSSRKLKDICLELNLPFVFVFHNESLSNHRGWENWDKVFSFWNHE